MKTHRKTAKKTYVSLMFVLLFSLSLFSQILNISDYGDGEQTTESVDFPSIQSANEYENLIYGQGDNRTQKIYLTNTSSVTSTDAFNISSNSADEYLSYGQYNFTFPKNYNTSYVLEDDTPLESPKFHSWSKHNEINLNNGTLSSGDNSSLQLNNDQYAKLICNTSDPKVVDIFASTDFSNYTYSNKTILGYQIQIKLTSNTSMQLNLTAKDFIDDDWDVISMSNNITGTTSPTIYTYNVINKNLRYLNDTKNSTFNFQFYNNTEDFEIDLYWVSISALRGQEIDLNSERSIALEFDTKGDCDVYGFQAWIRSFNVSNTNDGSNLTVQLYRSNHTYAHKRSYILESQKVKIAPNTTDTLIAENVYTNFAGDEPIWFNFTKDHSGKSLNISNYFVVISVNTTDADGGRSFSFVTLPYSSPDPQNIYADNDNKIDHLLLENSTGNWGLITLDGYPSIQCDAAAFSINLTRGWMPDELNVTIEEVLVTSSYIEDYPHDENGVYWWGLGTISHDYNTAIKSDGSNFTVSLSWDTSLLASVDFGVNYTVNKYFNKNSTTIYTLEIDTVPKWNVTFTYDANSFGNWKFLEMWYFVPLDWTVSSLIATDGVDYLENTTYEYNIDSQIVLKVNNESVVGLQSSPNGNYTLMSTSPNYIKNCSLNLRYKDDEWQTNGFMKGDNASVMVGVSDKQNKFIDNNGSTTVKLYNTTGHLNPSYILSDDTIDVNGTYSYYKFDKRNIFVTNDTVMDGEYNVIATWKNGEEAGIYKRPLYVNAFDSTLINSSYDEYSGNNQVLGLVDTIETDLDDYSLFMFAIQNTSLDGTDFVINDSLDYELANNLHIRSYAQNETVLNKYEDVKFIVELENRNTTINYDVTIAVDIISYSNDNWVIANASSPEKNLAIYGDTNGNDMKKFDITVSIPDMQTGGVNCPIRMGPMVAIIRVELDNKTVSQVPRGELLFYSNQTDAEFEGKVLAVNEYRNRVGPSFIAGFNRAALNIPGYTYYFAQISNKYYMSMDSEKSIFTYELATGEIKDLTVVETFINRSSTITLTGLALDEFGESIVSADLYLKYENTTGQFLPLNVSTTNKFKAEADGKFSIQVSLLQTPQRSNLVLQVSFLGNQNLTAFDDTVEIQINDFENHIKYYLVPTTIVVGYRNLMDVVVKNVGNSTLTNISLSLLESDFAGSINSKNVLTTDSLKPGQSLTFQIDFWDQDYDTTSANFTLKFESIVEETGEEFDTSGEYQFEVYRTNEEGLTTIIVLIVFFVSVALLWVVGIVSIRKKMKDMNKLPDDVEKDTTPRKRRGGKYVKISELSRKKPEDKADKKEQEKTSTSEVKPDSKKSSETKKSKKEESTSLDDLINQEKTKKVTKKSKKKK
jgi:hypothetical protein